MIVLDSNIWIAFLYKDDALHKEAEKIFGLSEKIIGVSEYVIIEVSTVLSQKAGKETANKFFEMVMRSKDIEVLFADDQFFIETGELFKKSKERGLSFVDYSLLYLSRLYQVVTFDKNLQRVIKKQII